MKMTKTDSEIVQRWKSIFKETICSECGHHSEHFASGCDRHGCDCTEVEDLKVQAAIRLWRECEKNERNMCCEEHYEDGVRDGRLDAEKRFLKEMWEFPQKVRKELWKNMTPKQILRKAAKKKMRG
jgi:hypothetical protein